MPRWTLESRKQQSDRLKLSIYQQRPWERSTGPTSAVGKAKAARNSLKHGLRWQSLSERESRAIGDLFSRLGRERKALLKKLSANFWRDFDKRTGTEDREFTSMKSPICLKLRSIFG